MPENKKSPIDKVTKTLRMSQKIKLRQYLILLNLLETLEEMHSIIFKANQKNKTNMLYAYHSTLHDLRDNLTR